MLNKPRKPWLSAVLTIVSIGLGHIYTGEAKRGILLFFIAQAVYLLSAFSLLLPVIPQNILAAVFLSLLFLSYCIIDAVKLSEKFSLSYDMKPYNKWYLYLLFFLITSFAVHPAVSMYFIDFFIFRTVDKNLLIPDFNGVISKSDHTLDEIFGRIFRKGKNNYIPALHF